MLLSLIVLFAISGCNSKKSAIKKHQKDAYIVVGQGGGFTGTYTQFKINGDGEIEEFDFSNESYSTISSLKPAQVYGFFQQLDSLNLGEVEMQNPGNMSQYIEFSYSDVVDHKILWPMEESSIKENIQNFFYKCYTFCKTQKGSAFSK